MEFFLQTGSPVIAGDDGAEQSQTIQKNRETSAPSLYTWLRLQLFVASTTTRFACTNLW
jgi:hypothetical protein